MDIVPKAPRQSFCFNPLEKSSDVCDMGDLLAAAAICHLRDSTAAARLSDQELDVILGLSSRCSGQHSGVSNRHLTAASSGLRTLPKRQAVFRGRYTQ